MRGAASVIICTHNRGRQLTLTLRAILAQDMPPDQYEVVIVDNASTDETPAVVGAFQSETHGHAVRSVFEPELGLSAARNAGIRHAHGDILAFTDDDAEPDPGWLPAVVEAYDDPGVWAAGGPVALIPNGEWPAWLSPRLRPYLAEWNRGADPVGLYYDDYPRGVNMSIRRQAFRVVGEFSTLLGRKGTRLLSYEEVEFFSRIERAGGIIRYAPLARVSHEVATERLSQRWFVRRLYWQGRSVALYDRLHPYPTIIRRRIKDLVGAWRAPTDSEPPTQVRAYRRCHLAMLYGYVLGLADARWQIPRARPLHRC